MLYPYLHKAGSDWCLMVALHDSLSSATGWGRMLHEPTSPPVGTERKAEKDVKTKQGIQQTCTMCTYQHIEPHTMLSAIDTYKCCYTVGIHYTSEPHTMHSAIDTYKCCYTVGMHYTSVYWCTSVAAVTCTCAFLVQLLLDLQNQHNTHSPEQYTGTVR